MFIPSQNFRFFLILARYKHKICAIEGAVNWQEGLTEATETTEYRD